MPRGLNVEHVLTKTVLWKEYGRGLDNIRRQILRETCFSCLSTAHGSMECPQNTVIFHPEGLRTNFSGRKTVRGWTKVVYFRSSPDVDYPKSIMKTFVSYEDAVAQAPELAQRYFPRYAPPVDSKTASQLMDEIINEFSDDGETMGDDNSSCFHQDPL